ncbi:S-adenosyl-L-methionine-dependent methyltransferase [Trametes cingulata]|nr:S-adenosyl-L-methionine-dependent methyltransferase [Trametes cingulata]
MKRTVDPPRTASPAKKPRSEQGSPEIRRRPKATVWVEVPSRSARQRRDVEVSKYEPVGDEVTECAEVRIAGETAPEEVEEEDSVPVRTLDNFAVFDSETREFLPFEQLLGTENTAHSTWVAAGPVGTYIEDSSDDSDSDEDSNDEEDGGDDPVDAVGVPDGAQRLQLTPILECDAHFVTRHGRNYDIDSRIYLRTKFAWYILLRPSSSYQRYYATAWTRHRIVQALLSTLVQDPRASLQDVLNAIHTPPGEGHPTRPAFDSLAGPICEDDLTSDDLMAYLIRVLDRLQYDHPLLHHKLVYSKLVQKHYPALSSRKPPSSPPPKSLKASRRTKARRRTPNQTYVTPRVKAIAQKLFTQALRVAELADEPAEETPSAHKERRVHAVDPTTMEWVEESRTAPHHYGSVLIDGTLYTAGDVVIVEPGHDQHRTRAENARQQRARCCENVLADTKWFCKIAYMFEKRDSSGRWRKYFHAHWLQHGSQTLLQEAAHPRTLFWLNECEDQLLECIYSHCNLEEWPVGDASPPEDPEGDVNRFHVGLTWDSENCAFSETSPAETSQALAKCEPWKECVSCGLAALRDERESWRSLPGNQGVSRSGVDYHVHDFVYLREPGQLHGLFSIAQIVDFISSDTEGFTAVKVTHYGRYDDIVTRDCNQDGPIHRDNRRLYRTKVSTKVQLSCVSGKAFVACPPSPREVEVFIQQDDHFYCDLQADTLSVKSLDDLDRLSEPSISQCEVCCTAAAEAALDRERLLQTSSPLKGLELFAGAGGLSTGLEMSGCIQTQWAVELDPSAARSYKANHPDATVYNQCTNKLLEHAIQVCRGACVKPLRSLDEDACKELPNMPEPGEVDFIYGGPPCQSFSIMNHFRHPDDIRSTLVCNMTSYVEFYRPIYFLLENVYGMLSYPVKKKDHHGDQGIQMGVVKFIMVSLITLGYQVHFRVLQAGQHGAPQGRRRVIFLGARRGVPLPQFPLPQYNYDPPVHKVKLSTGEELHPASYWGGDGCLHQCAPLPPVTVMEAINDLPRFDWSDPHITKQATAQDLKESKSRIAEGISCFNACRAMAPQDAPLPGYPHAVPYAHSPLSRYQSWVRAGNGGTVLYHYTGWYSGDVVERVVNVPLEPGAGHQDLPPVLRNSKLFDEATQKPKPGSKTLYGRVDGSKHFVTAMTTLAPNAKGGRVLHPDQKRVLSIRECARAQGFPDRYRFLSVNKKSNDIVADQMRQIGNAVPVPLGLALGKGIREAFCRLWKDREEQGLAEKARSPEVFD